MAPSDKFERLMNLLAALLEADRPISAEQIHSRVHGYAEEKDAFRRTFERDKEELRELGVTIELRDIPGTSPILQGYYVDRDDYELPDPGLSPDEIAALRLALQVVKVGDPDLDGTGSNAALWRLGGVPDEPERADGTSIAAVPVDPRIADLFTAVLERRVTAFTYRKTDGSDLRTVEPWRLDYRRGHWYLTAHDRDRGDQRNFRLDRMDDDLSLGPRESFTGPAPAAEQREFRAWSDGSDDATEALLRVDQDRAEWAAELLGPGTIEEVHPDGATDFRVPVTSWPAFRSFVLSFLDHAELLEPPSLRADLVSWLTELAEADER